MPVSFDDLIPAQKQSAQPLSFDDLIPRQGFAPQAAQAPAPRTTGEQLGLGTRAVVQGLAALPGMAYDLAAIPQNLLSKIPGLEQLRVAPAAHQVSGALTAAGMPQPKTDAERTMGAAIEAAAGVPTGYGAGALAAKVASPAAQQLARILQGAPAEQAALSAAGGAGAEVSRQALGENIGEAPASLLGGVAATLAPGAAVSLGRRAITPMPSRLTAEQARLVQEAQAEGIRLPVSALTGSERMAQLESVLRRLPFSGGMAQAEAQGTREQFQKAVMARAGETASEVSPATIDRAFGRLGQQFDDLARQTTVPLDAQFAFDIGGIAQNYANRLPSDIRPVVVSRLENLAAKVGTTMSGSEFQNVSSDLRRAARTYQGRDPYAGEALNKMFNALDDAGERSFGPGLRDEWRQTRREYRNLLPIAGAASSGTAGDRVVGNLPLGAFQQAVRAQDPRGYARGRGEMNTLSRIGNLIADKVPDSGTAQRSYLANLLTLSGAGVTGGLIGGVPGVIAGLAIPPAVQAFIQSAPGRAYLTNQLFAGPSPLSPQARAAALANVLAQQGAPQ